ncbi:MAG: hypothetical protein FWC34_00365 [Bacteroidetes bacterium]|nr:hypothetical protein [Bacteroidota bacterium]
MERLVDFMERLVRQVFKRFVGREMRPIHPWTSGGAFFAFFIAIPFGILLRIIVVNFGLYITDTANIVIAVVLVLVSSPFVERLGARFSKDYSKNEKNDNSFFYAWIWMSALMTILIITVGRDLK